MAKISPAEMTAGVAIALLVQRRRVFGEAGVAQVELPRAQQRLPVAGNARRQHAVEDIHAARNPLDEVFRRPHAHQIAGLVARQLRRGESKRAQHRLLRLADGEAADGVAGEIERGEELHALRPQVGEDAALHDAEERLILAVMGGLAPLGPAMRPRQRLHIVGVIVRRGALIQHHRDVGPQVHLDLHHPLRGEAVDGAVDVRTEGYPVVVDGAQRFAPLAAREAEDLEAAGVGEDRPRPAHKAVQPAQTCDALIAGAQVEVVGVGEHEDRADLLQLTRRNRLHRRPRPHRREDRRGDDAVRRVEAPCPCLPLLGQKLVAEKAHRPPVQKGGRSIRQSA